VASRVLVVGGGRFIGRAIVAKLAESAEVTLANRGITSPPPAGVEHLRVDVAELTDARVVLGRRHFDVAVLTSIYTPWELMPWLDALGDSFPHMVLTTTAGVHASGIRGETDEESPLASDEECLTRGRGHYYREKIACERLARRHSGRGRSVTVLRPNFVYGPHDYNPWVWSVFHRIVSGVPVAVPHASARVQLLYVDDLASAYRAAIDRSREGFAAYLCAGGEVVSPRDFLAACATQCGRSAYAFKPSDDQCREPGLPDWMRAECAFNTGRIERDLGWKAATGLNTGLRRAFDWFCANTESLGLQPLDLTPTFSLTDAIEIPPIAGDAH